MTLYPQAFAFAVLGFVGAGPARADTYAIDAAHSSVTFTIRHEGLLKLNAGFSKFSGTVTWNPGLTAVEASIDVASLDTHRQGRDAALKSPDYFDVAKFPNITFQSKAWNKTGESTYDVVGDLTIKAVTKEVTLQVKLLGMDADKGTASWDAKTTLNRMDFGVSGPSVLDHGIANKLDVVLHIEAKRESP